MDPRLLQFLMTIFGQGSGDRFNLGAKGRGNRFGDSSSPADFDDGTLLGALSQLNNQQSQFDQDIPSIKSRQISDRSLPRFDEGFRFGGRR